MNKTDWTEQLRKRMERQEEPVDDSLWAGIEQALDSPSVGKRPAHGLSLRRWIAAAAVLLGLVAGSVYWLSRHGEQAVARLERPKAPMERKARTLRELLHDEAESPLSKAVARLSWPVVPENTDRLGCVEPAEVADTTADYVARNVPKGSASDRKSTRLNSSHANISYAVFCLKKKITPKPMALLADLVTTAGLLTTTISSLTLLTTMSRLCSLILDLTTQLLTSISADSIYAVF